MLKPCNGDDLTLTIARALEERAEQLRHQHLLNMIGEAMNTLHQSGEASAPLPLPPRPASVPAEMAAQDIERVGVIALDRQKRQVTLKSDPPRTVELTEGEMSILAAMMERPNQVFTCNQLARAAFGYDGMDKWTVESVVRSCVFRLRSKIEPDSDAPRLICTVRGRGYYFSPA
jgi:DNA-binding response OmpR family regulator